MTRLLDLIAISLLLAAAAAFSYGVHALGERKDLNALYLLLVGALCLKAATDLLRPRAGDT